MSLGSYSQIPLTLQEQLWHGVGKLGWGPAVKETRSGGLERPGRAGGLLLWWCFPAFVSFLKIFN